MMCSCGGGRREEVATGRLSGPPTKHGPLKCVGEISVIFLVIHEFPFLLYMHCIQGSPCMNN